MSGPLPACCAAIRRAGRDKAATIGVTDGLVHLGLPSLGAAVAGATRGLMAMEYTRRDAALAQRTHGWVPKEVD